MPLDAFDHEILGFEIVGGVGRIAQGHGISDRFLVTENETGDVILGGYGIFEFIDSRFTEKVAESAGRIGIERADAFGDFVDRLKKIFVLLVESVVEREEAGAFNVPVGDVSVGHECVRVGDEQVETLDNSRVGFDGSSGGG